LEAETVAVGEATEAMTAFETLMAANPIGLAIAGVTGLAIAWASVADNAKNAAYYEDKAQDAADKADQKFYDNRFKTVIAPRIEKDAAEDLKSFHKVSKEIQDAQIETEKSTVDIYQKKLKNAQSSGDDLKIEGAKEGLYRAQYLLGKFQGNDKTQNKPINSSLPSADSVKADNKQVVNTWNIKEFGKSINTFSGVSEGGDKVHDKMLEALTTAVNDSEIASGQ